MSISKEDFFGCDTVDQLNLLLLKRGFHSISINALLGGMAGGSRIKFIYQDQCGDGEVCFLYEIASGSFSSHPTFLKFA